MALNVPIDNQGVPIPLLGQQFLIKLNQINFQVKIQKVGKKKLKGTAFLTTYRMILVSQKQSNDFCSFQVPLHLLFEYKVKFPLFGSIYIDGSCRPYKNLLPENSNFKLWFKKDEYESFVRILRNLIEEIHTSRNKDNIIQNKQELTSKQHNDDKQFNNCNYKALVDPNDPSKVYAEMQISQ